MGARPPAAAPPSAAAATIRRTLLQLVVSVLALHGVAIALYRFAGIDAAPTRTRGAFTIVWTVATFLVVSVFLRRIRAARRSGGAKGKG